MQAVPLISCASRWECPGCPSAHVTRLAQPHAPMHPCPGAGGLLVPFVPAGSRVKVTVTEREDWVAGERVPLDAAGRAVMSVTLEDDNHRSAVVYVPVAQGRGGAS